MGLQKLVQTAVFNRNKRLIEDIDRVQNSDGTFTYFHKKYDGVEFSGEKAKDIMKKFKDPGRVFWEALNPEGIFYVLIKELDWDNNDKYICPNCGQGSFLVIYSRRSETYVCGCFACELFVFSDEDLNELLFSMEGFFDWTRRALSANHPEFISDSIKRIKTELTKVKND